MPSRQSEKAEMNSIILIVIICLFLLYILKYAQLWLARFRLGLPGPPPPLPYIGDIFHILRHGHKAHEEQLRLLKRYGRVTAYTFLGQIYILMTDPEVMKAVAIKKFDYFTGVEAPGLKLTKPPYNSMISISGQRWRRIRNTISPIFTTSMLKHMMKLMRQSVLTFMEKIEKAADERKMVDAHEYAKLATMEIIVKTSFSINAQSQVDKNDPFMKNAISSMASVMLLQLVASLPLAGYLFSLISDPCDFDYMVSTAQQIIKQRRQGIGENYRDFVQLLLNTQKNEDEQLRLSEDEIVAQSLIFLMAGYDSTSSAVAFLIYILAMHPEAQEKVREEIDREWPDAEAEELSYEMLQEMNYLDMCYQESQRLYSIAYHTTRCCAEDCEIEGIPFKKGMIAVFPIYAIHRLPEIWPDPEKFIPERFTLEEKAKRNPYVFMPFGHGPRNCVGMRFATLNVKLLVVSLLKRFVVLKTEKTMDPMECTSSFVIDLPKGSIMVEFQRR